MPAHDHLWDDSEVGRYLNVSVWTVRTWRQQGKLGCVRMGNVIRYVPEEVKAFAIAHRKAPRCSTCGNNSEHQGEVRLPGEVKKNEPGYFSEVQIA